MSTEVFRKQVRVIKVRTKGIVANITDNLPECFGEGKSSISEQTFWYISIFIFHMSSDSLKTNYFNANNGPYLG